MAPERVLPGRASVLPTPGQGAWVQEGALQGGSALPPPARGEGRRRGWGRTCPAAHASPPGMLGSPRSGDGEASGPPKAPDRVLPRRVRGSGSPVGAWRPSPGTPPPPRLRAPRASPSRLPAGIGPIPERRAGDSLEGPAERPPGSPTSSNPDVWSPAASRVPARSCQFQPRFQSPRGHAHALAETTPTPDSAPVGLAANWSRPSPVCPAPSGLSPCPQQTSPDPAPPTRRPRPPPRSH